LYGREACKSDTPSKNKEIFDCAIELIIEDCKKDILGLVEETNESGHYKITALGEAAIDTGTEISTIEPLLDVTKKLARIWNEILGSNPFPEELYIFSLVCQEEVYRDYIRYAPECRRSSNPWNNELQVSNREEVRKSTANSLQRMGLSTELSYKFAGALQVFLDELPVLGTVEASYSKGASDSLLRFFCGLISWVNGEERNTKVLKYIEGTGSLTDENTGRMQKFRQFTEVFSFKLLFLHKLLTKSKKFTAPLTVEAEKKLHLLASRVRLGCSVEAIPLFYPSSSNLNRPQVKQILEAGLTPSYILATNPREYPTTPYLSSDKLIKLREDLESYALNKFRELQGEMTAVRDQEDYKREKIYSFVQEVDRKFEVYIEQFIDERKKSPSFNESIHDCLNFSKSTDSSDSLVPKHTDNRYRVRVATLSSSNNTVTLAGERLIHQGNDEDELIGEYLEEHKIEILGVVFKNDGRCSLDGNSWKSFDALLRDEQIENSNLVVVAMPWLPRQKVMNDDIQQLLIDKGINLTFITPASFTVMLTIIVRGFTNGKSLIQDLSRANDTSFKTMNIDRLRRIIEENQVIIPLSIKDKLLDHFEVDSQIPLLAT
jgi:hypothetical protein